MSTQLFYFAGLSAPLLNMEKDEKDKISISMDGQHSEMSKKRHTLKERQYIQHSKYARVTCFYFQNPKTLG